MGWGGGLGGGRGWGVAGAEDAGGGAPFGEDDGVVVVEVGDDVIGSFDDGAAIFVEEAGFLVGGDVYHLIGGEAVGVADLCGEMALEGVLDGFGSCGCR